MQHKLNVSLDYPETFKETNRSQNERRENELKIGLLERKSKLTGLRIKAPRTRGART